MGRARLVGKCRAAIDEASSSGAMAFAATTTARTRRGELGALGALGPVPTMRGWRAWQGAGSRHHAQHCQRKDAWRAAWLTDLQQAIGEGSRRATDMIVAIDRLAVRSGELMNMEYEFLYDKERHLLAIGYNATERRGLELLRLAGLGGAPVQFRGDCAGTVAAGRTGCPQAPAHRNGRRAGAAVVEWLDVRVPDATSGDAML